MASATASSRQAFNDKAQPGNRKKRRKGSQAQQGTSRSKGRSRDGPQPFQYYTAREMAARKAPALLAPRGRRTRLPPNRNQSVLALISATSPSRSEQRKRSPHRHLTSGVGVLEWAEIRISSAHITYAGQPSIPTCCVLQHIA